MDRAYFNWSSGKDSALALYKTLRAGRHEVAALYTSVYKEDGRTLMHGVDEALVRRQAQRMGLPLALYHLDPAAPAATREAELTALLEGFRRQGVTTALFGDIFLEDIRAWREEKLAPLGFRVEFPLWGMGTGELMAEYLALGFRAVVTCVDGAALDESFVGRELDESFLRDLPPGADPCGENGEYHSFVYDGPLFKEPVPFERGRVYCKEYEEGGRFWHCDLLAQ